MTVKHLPEPTFADLETLARTVYGEARGESRKGWAAVAWTICNRAADPRWPETIGGVCLQRSQFSCWLHNDPNRDKLLAVGVVELADILNVCLAVLTGKIADPTAIAGMPSGANHYLTTALAERGAPFWFRRDAITVVLGHHTFLRL